MCIICNINDELTASRFLDSFEAARAAMRKSAADMMAVRDSAPNKETRKRYDRTHKRMVKIIREWNGVEHEREK